MMNESVNGLSMNHRRRVVITGLGVVAPNGTGKDDFWHNLVAGTSAVGPISLFDASPYPCRVGAELPIVCALDAPAWRIIRFRWLRRRLR